MGALRMKLANARDLQDPGQLKHTVEDVLEGLGHEIDGLRHLITELRPAALDDLGLEAALQALARRAQAIDGLDVAIEMNLPSAEGETGTRRLDPELESTLYRIVQEALTNVSRHAEASRRLHVPAPILTARARQPARKSISSWMTFVCWKAARSSSLAAGGDG